MYNKEHYDHLFYRMRRSIPTSKMLFLLISIIKLYPIFLFSHTGGFSTPKNDVSTIHSYYRYFSITFYLQNSFGSSSIMMIVVMVLVLNLLGVLGLIYYLAISKKVKKIDENYGNVSSVGYLFHIFSNATFFKYIILFQFFEEINFIPLLCISNVIDYEKIYANKIFSTNDLQSQINGLCGGNNLYVLLVISCVNVVIDLFFYWLLTVRFFDFNILSEYKWNFYPNLFLSFEFLESFAQVFYIPFHNYKNKTFKLIFDIYILVVLVAEIYRRIKQNIFYTESTQTIYFIAEFIRYMCYFSSLYIVIFQMGFDLIPNDINVLGLIIFEAIFVFLYIKFSYRNDSLYIKNVLVSPLNQLNEKNIYGTLIFLIKEFKIFSDITHKFSDYNLDLFLENYVDHLKICEDVHCPCKNYVKKVTGASNTIKSGYTTVINFTHMKKDQQEEYILNKFFNVLAANINTTIKYNNNVNLANIKDSQRQKLIYQLRTKLITAVKKLLSYKLEKLTSEIEGVLTNQFKKETKDFIRINFFSVNILCNKSYFKTQFLFYEFLSDYFKRNDYSYHFNLIYYFYLKMFSIKEYNNHQTSSKPKKEHSSSGFHLDFRTVLSLCVKYYEIEKKLIRTAEDYEGFIKYFSTDKIVFDKLLVLIKKFKSDYKNVTRYISHYFKNDKINNLFVCTKIILFFKILHFDIPETLHNKLIIQVHDTEENNKVHSYIDSNYYMILNYINGEFVIKFISHELLIVLEYSEDELRDQDFHVLFPEKMRKLHKNTVINEIKSRTITQTNKEIFFVSKKQTCVLFDIQYKPLLNLRGEITLLTVVNLKKPPKDFRVCFACIDEHGDVLALNKEFEEFLVLSMKVLDYVKIDTEKVILQGMGERMRKFFKDDENRDFQEQFDYEQYLSSLFDEEFENLKEKNEKEYKRKLARWEVLKEMNRKGRYYTRYIELNIKQRCLGREKIYFLKYSVKITLSLRSIEPHSTTLSLIHAVKISKREMAKLSFYRGDEIYESKSEKSVNEEKVNESHDDLFESQSQISSAVSQLKERNSVRLFRQKRSTFKFLPKSRNILFLMVFIGILAIISVIFNIVSLVLKHEMYKETRLYLNLDLNSLFLKKNFYILSSSMVLLALIEENIIYYNSTQNLPIDLLNNLKHAISSESALMNNVTYNISYLSSQFYQDEIEQLLSLETSLIYLFDNGFIYNKTINSIYQEITNLKKQSLDVLTKYEDMRNSNDDNDDINEQNSLILQYFFTDRIKDIQDTSDIPLEPFHNQAMTVYFLMKNTFETINDYLDNLILSYDNLLHDKQNRTLKFVVVMKIIEFIIVGLIIAFEWVFIYFGYEKAKKKMIKLRQKVERNNIAFTLKKIGEFVHFSNNFNIGSLYYIADLDLKKVEESNKTMDVSNTGSKSFSTLISQTTPRKKFMGSQFYGGQGREDSFNVGDNNNSIKLGEELRGTSQKPFHDFTMEGDKTPQNDPDGKKNLLKVMNKLEMIKGIKKPKDFEKKESEKSKQSEGSSGIYNSENANNVGMNNGVSNTNTNVNNGNMFAGVASQHDNSELRNMSSAFESEFNAFNSNNVPVKPALSNKDKFAALSSLVDENRNNNKNYNIAANGIKPALRGSSKNNVTVGGFGVKFNNNAEDGNGQHDEDSKVPMIKQQDESLLQKKPQRTPKVQFKDKKVTSYFPNLSVKEGGEISNQLKSTKIDRKELNSKEQNDNNNNNMSNNMNIVSNNMNNMLGNNMSNYNNGNIDPNNINANNMNMNRNDYASFGNKFNADEIGLKRGNEKPLLSTLQSGGVDGSLNIGGTGGVGVGTTPTPGQGGVKRLTQGGEEIQITNLKMNQFNQFNSQFTNYNKYQLIEQGKAVTVKKKQEINEKDIPKKEVIEYKIDNVIHNNFMARIILNVTLLSFLTLYIVSIVLNFLYESNISGATSYANLLFSKTTLLTMIILKYQFNVILNSHDKVIERYVKLAEDNKKSLSDFEVFHNPEILPLTYQLVKSIKLNESCEYFSELYSKAFSTDYKDEYNECIGVGAQMNVNGFLEAESYVLSTMIVLMEDWNNFANFINVNITDVILTKLRDETYFNILCEVVYTFRKYTMLLMDFIFVDIAKIFDSILLNERIFGYFSICMNILFLMLSLIFIIYPIKSVEMMITWLIHKIMKN